MAHVVSSPIVVVHPTDGRNIVFVPDRYYDVDAALLKAYPGTFAAADAGDTRIAKPVEKATKAPGEKRSVKRPAAKKASK